MHVGAKRKTCFYPVRDLRSNLEFCGEILNLITDACNARIFEQYVEEKYNTRRRS